MTLRVASESFLTVDQVRNSPNCGCISANSPSDEIVQGLIDQASDMIAIVTGLRIAGRQSVIARPCRTGDYCVCECCGLDAIPLGDERPVVTEVWVNGVQLEDNQWWLHWNRVSWMLARLPVDGETSPRDWPSFQDRWRPETDEGTLAIHFTQGIHTDDHIIVASALEIVCDLASDDTIAANAMEGVSSVNAGAVNVVVNPNVVAYSDDTRLKRIANGELGPFTRRMIGIMAPTGRSYSMVWSPELTSWELWLEIDRNPPVPTP